MFKCPECDQPTKFHDLCNDCVDKFMKELDEELKDMDRPLWSHNFGMLSPWRFFRKKLSRKKGV